MHFSGVAQRATTDDRPARMKGRAKHQPSAPQSQFRELTLFTQFVIRILSLILFSLSDMWAFDAIDPSFNPVIRGPGTVRCVAWNSVTSKIFASVSGDKINGQILTSNLVRLDRAGNLDQTFAPSINGTVTAIAVQQDGRTIIAGSFSSVDGHTSPKVARLLLDGTVDTSFVASGSYLPMEVRALAVASDGTIYAGAADSGFGMSFQPPLLYKFGVNGALIEPFGPSFSSASSSIPSIDALLLLPTGEIVVGGNFSKAGAITQNYVAKLGADGVLDTVFKPTLTYSSTSSFSRPIRALGDGGASGIYVGGDFTKVNGVSQAGVARLASNGARDASFSPQLTGSPASVSGIAVDSAGRIVLAGKFTISVVTGTRPPSGISKSNLARLDGAGVLDTAFGSTISNWNDLELMDSDDVLVASTGLSASNGFVQPPVMRFLSSGIRDDSLQIELRRRDNPESIYLRPGKGPLLGGTWLKEVNGVETGNLAATTPTGQVDNTFNLVLDPGASVASTLVLPNGRILIGGNFSTVGALSRPKLALLEADGSPVETFDLGAGPSTNVTVLRLLPSGKVLAGGLFSTINGRDAKGVALLDLASLPATRNLIVEEILEARYGTSQASNDVLQVIKSALVAGKVNLSISTTTMGGDPAPGSTKYLTLRYRTNRGERTARIGGNSLILPNVPWDSGLIDLTFRPAHTEALFLDDATGQPDGKIILLGSFSTFAGYSIPKMVRLFPDGSVDTAFQPATQFSSFTANAVRAAPNGQIYIGTESLTLSGGSTARGLYRLTASGSNDPTFICPSFIRYVNAIVPMLDGGVWCSGEFNNVPTGGRQQVAKLLPNGSVDPGFDAGSAANGIYATADHGMALETPDKLWLVGNFTAFQGTSRDGVASIRLNSGLAPLAQIVPKSITVTDGIPATFGLTHAGSGETYTWLRNGVTIPGATGPSLTLTSHIPVATQTYTARVVNASGTTTSSGSLTVREALLAEWLSMNGLNGLQAADDSDGDGVSNASEYLARTNPVDGTSVFATGIEFHIGSVRLRWKTYPGRQYFIEKSLDLRTWISAGNAIAGDGGEKVVNATYSANDSSSYWRVRLAKP